MLYLYSHIIAYCADLSRKKDFRQHRTIASAAFAGSFAPILQFEKLEIHTVFLRFPNFILEQNLSSKPLAELCGVAFTMLSLTLLRISMQQKRKHPPAHLPANVAAFYFSFGRIFG